MCCCFLLWDSGGGTSAKSAAAIAWLPSLLIHCFVAFLLCYVFFFLFRLFDAHPHPRPQFWRRHLQDHVDFQRKHTKIIMGREFTYFSGRRAFLRIFFFRKHSIRAQTTSVPPGAEAFTAGSVDIPVTATVAAVRTTVWVSVRNVVVGANWCLG